MNRPTFPATVKPHLVHKELGFNIRRYELLVGNLQYYFIRTLRLLVLSYSVQDLRIPTIEGIYPKVIPLLHILPSEKSIN